MFFCLFVFVFSTFGTFFCSYEHIFQIRLVTINYKRKVILSYHKNLCCWSPQRFSRFSLPPTRQRLFRAPEVWSFLKTPAYSYHKSYSACPKRDDTVFRFSVFPSTGKNDSNTSLRVEQKRRKTLCFSKISGYARTRSEMILLSGWRYIFTRLPIVSFAVKHSSKIFQS